MQTIANNAPWRKLPPAGFYEIVVTNYCVHWDHISAVLELRKGPFAGYRFADTFHRGTRRARNLYDGLSATFGFCEPNKATIARLVHRVVNGEKTLALAQFGGAQ